MSRKPDSVICLAHRRWSGEYDRAQHLMSQCARERRVIWVEEPELDTGGPEVEVSETRTGVLTLIPHLPSTMTLDDMARAQQRALDFVMACYDCDRPVLWYYEPRALAFTEHICAAPLVYDWVDVGPSAGSHLGHRANQLLGIADIVFTDTRDHRQLVHHNVVPTDEAKTWPELWQKMWSAVEMTIANTVQAESFAG